MDLDLPADLGDLEDLGIGDLLDLLEVLGDVLLDRAALRPADVLPGLLGDPLLRDGHLGLVDLEGVGGDLAADNRLSEPVDALDDDVLRSVVGVHGEHDPGVFGVDHLLDDDGQLDVLVRVALLLPVGYGAGVEEGGPAFPDLVEEVLLVLDVQIGVLLPGEGRIGEVLGGRGGPDRNEPFLPVQEQLVVLLDLLLEVGGDLVLGEEVLDLLGCRYKGVVGVGIDLLDGLHDLRHDLAGFYEIIISNSGQHESVGHREPGGRELSEVSSLPSDDGDVADAELVRINDHPFLDVRVDHGNRHSGTGLAASAALGMEILFGRL